MFTRFKRFIREEKTWFKLSYKFRWAHHPTCTPYSNQRFDIFGVSLCQGCSIITIFGIIAFSSSLLLGKKLFYGLYYLLILVILIVGLIDGLNLGRPYKRFARASMGSLLGGSVAQVIINTRFQRIFIILTIFLIYQFYKIFRKHKHSTDICLSCNELSIRPRCSGIIAKLEANKRYQELILPIIDQTYLAKLESRAQQDLSQEILDLNSRKQT